MSASRVIFLIYCYTKKPCTDSAWLFWLCHKNILLEISVFFNYFSICIVKFPPCLVVSRQTLSTKRTPPVPAKKIRNTTIHAKTALTHLIFCSFFCCWYLLLLIAIPFQSRALYLPRMIFARTSAKFLAQALASSMVFLLFPTSSRIAWLLTNSLNRYSFSMIGPPKPLWRLSAVWLTFFAKA